jgi:hypothetical protein
MVPLLLIYIEKTQPHFATWGQCQLERIKKEADHIDPASF